MIEEGRQGHEFFLLVDGRSTSREGRESSSRPAAPSSARWRSLAPSAKRDRDRDEPGQRARRPRAGFRRLLHDSPEIQLKVLKTLADRAVENALH